MATAILRKRKTWYGPGSSGISMSPWEFDRAQFVRGYRYELINGVLIVSPSPSENERDPNGELDYLLRGYQKEHPQGHSLDATLAEHTIRTVNKNRRKADRCIWTGLGRLPKLSDVPSIVAEFVSEGKRNAERDYEIKRNEYWITGVQEYWIFDRFSETVTVYYLSGQKLRKRIFTKNDTLTTPLLPGFELPLANLFKLANRWKPENDEDEL